MMMASNDSFKTQKRGGGGGLQRRVRSSCSIKEITKQKQKRRQKPTPEVPYHHRKMSSSSITKMLKSQEVLDDSPIRPTLSYTSTYSEPGSPTTMSTHSTKTSKKEYCLSLNRTSIEQSLSSDSMLSKLVDARNLSDSRRKSGEHRDKGSYDRDRHPYDENDCHDHSNDDSSSDDESKIANQFYDCNEGDELNGRYRVVDELGKGTFGRVFEAYEIDPNHWKELIGFGHMRGLFSNKTSGVFAIKIIRLQSRYIRDAEIEADMLRYVNNSGPKGRKLFPMIHDEFYLDRTGHKCLCFEKLGLSLYEIMKMNDFVAFPTSIVRDVAMQLFDALDHIHSVCNIVHTDIKPENLLLVPPPHNPNPNDEYFSSEYTTQIKLIDFGSAVYHDDKHKSTIVQTRQYRGPEILLEIGWSFPSDVWAAGCTISELYIGHVLFNAKDNNEHIALMEKKIESFPKSMVYRAKKRIKDQFYVGPTNCAYKINQMLPSESVSFVNSSYTLKQNLGRTAMTSGLCSLLSKCLMIDPKSRATANQAKVMSKLIIDPLSRRQQERKQQRSRSSNL